MHCVGIQVACSDAVIEEVLAEEFEEHLDDDDFWEDDFEPEAEVCLLRFCEGLRFRVSKKMLWLTSLSPPSHLLFSLYFCISSLEP